MKIKPEFLQQVGIECAQEIQEKVDIMQAAVEIAMPRRIPGITIKSVHLEVIAEINDVPCIIRMPFDFYD